jgi:hypothetical protein
MSKPIVRITGAIGAALLAVALLSGCSDIRAERAGRDLGRAICDVKNADSAEEAQSAFDDLQEHLDKVSRRVGAPVDQDVNALQENLSDLREHVADGDENLAQQDINAINRNVQQAADQLEGTSQAAYDGVSEGLGECN